MFNQLELTPDSVSRASVPKIITVVDLETTGLDPAEDQVIELAAAMFSVEHRQVLQSVCFMIPCIGDNPAERINHIAADLTRVPTPWMDGMHLFEQMVKSSDALLAHNSNFDSAWFGHGYLKEVTIPWLCTMRDFDFGCRGASGLRDLAANHGVPITRAHRALADVELVTGVLESREDLDELVARAVAPKITVMANVSFARKDEAKIAGFRWNQAGKRWEKMMTVAEYHDAIYSFTTKIID